MPDIAQISPWLGDTRPKKKGGKAAERTLTSMTRECKQYRDDMRGFRDELGRQSEEFNATANRAVLVCAVSVAVNVVISVLTVLYHVVCH